MIDRLIDLTEDVVPPEHTPLDPAHMTTRIVDYLLWWERRPSRWLAFLREDESEEVLPDLLGADSFWADDEAHWAAVGRGLLVQDPRPDTGAWQLSGRGLCFVHEHYRDPPPAE